MAASIAWRIPTTGDPRLLKLALMQVGLATVVGALLLIVAAPRDWLVPALAGLVPLAVFMAYRRWYAFQQALAGDDNVRLDAAGLHWVDAAGVEQSFSRDMATGFHIDRQRDTLRPVASPTLHLRGGFESQPIELHPPATPEGVRALLATQWRIAEQPAPARDDGASAYDRAIPVYSECHDEFQEWHWEGTAAALADLANCFAEAAQDPLPPPGAKPALRVVLAQRRTPARVGIGHGAYALFEHDQIIAPATVLRAIASQMSRLPIAGPDPSDHSFDVGLGPRDTWTFHLHLRE
jgi:hypothetical protein